jgi:hypothetical protein
MPGGPGIGPRPMRPRGSWAPSSIAPAVANSAAAKKIPFIVRRNGGLNVLLVRHRSQRVGRRDKVTVKTAHDCKGANCQTARTARRRELPDGAECQTARSARRREMPRSARCRTSPRRRTHRRFLAPQRPSAFAPLGICAVGHLRRWAFAPSGICAVGHLAPFKAVRRLPDLSADVTLSPSTPFAGESSCPAPRSSLV